ncbi:MAG: hypothetical protein ABW110_17920 [Steroidobacteraceae bacterium]
MRTLGLFSTAASLVWLAAFFSTARAAVDIPHNPGCGMKTDTPQARIERNRRIAEYHFQGFLAAKKLNWLYTIWDQPCFAKDATIYSWMMGEPLSTAKTKPSYYNAAILQKEIVAQWKVMPDYGIVPGSLVVYPWDGGVQFRYTFEGHTPDGTLHHLWEILTLIINDEGKITHWEFWDDVVGTNDITKVVVGKDILAMLKDRRTGDAYTHSFDRVIKEGRAIPPAPDEPPTELPDSAALPNEPVAATMDVRTNPGCGTKPATTQEKTARNAIIAQFYAQAYTDIREKRLATWFDYGCFAKGATTTNWLMEPLTSAKPRPLLNTAKLMQQELAAYRKVMPDYAAMPDKLVAHAWDGGVTFSTVFQGHTKDGVAIEVWEVNTLLINDEGKITHWEFWKDNKAQDEVFQRTYGKRVLGDSGLMHVTGMSYADYVATIKAGPR